MRALPASRLLTLLGLVAAVLVPRPARADAWGAFKGRIVASATPFGSGYPTDAALIAALKKQATPVVHGGTAWTLHLMVFLSEPAGSDKIDIVYSDVTVKPRHQVSFIEVDVKPTQKMVQLDQITLTTSLGFVGGHRYDVLATRLIGGKEKVYAKTTVTLK